MIATSVQQQEPHISLNLSTEFLDKSNHAQISQRTGNNTWAFSFSFYPQRVTVSEFVQHVLDGKAWTPGFFQGNQRIKGKFVSAQLLALDFDHDVSVAKAKENLFIRTYALMVYATPTSKADAPKTRVVFMLDEEVHDAERWTVIQKALIHEFQSWKPDEACHDASRLFYGSTNRIEAPLVNLNARLPLLVVGSMTIDAALAEEAERTRLANLPEAEPIDRSSDRAKQIMQTRLQRAGEIVASSGEGTRHKALLNRAIYLFAHLIGDWPISESEIRRELYHAAVRNGMVAKYGEKEVERIINDGQTYARKPIPLTITDFKKKKKPPGTDLFMKRIDDKPVFRRWSYAIVTDSNELQERLVRAGYPALAIHPDDERAKYIPKLLCNVPMVFTVGETGLDLQHLLRRGRVLDAHDLSEIQAELKQAQVEPILKGQ